MSFLDCICALVPGLLSVWKFQDLLIFFWTKKKNGIFSHFPFIFNWGHIDPKDHICKKMNFTYLQNDRIKIDKTIDRPDYR